jgi:LmbE family N-acetylglucosaminyl deacetylase
MSAMPLCKSPWRRARWLVFAPHPDDETLGAGALLHQMAAEERLAGVIYLTDGSGSHPPGTPHLRSVRRREARRATSRLATHAAPIDWLGWEDGRPHATGSLPFRHTARRIAAILSQRRVDALAVSDPGDAHCDHVAAFEVAAASCAAACRKVQIFTYSVWGEPSTCGLPVRTSAIPQGQRRGALAAHRSQLSPALGEGFRLPSGMRRMRACDTLRAVDWPR